MKKAIFYFITVALFSTRLCNADSLTDMVQCQGPVTKQCKISLKETDSPHLFSFKVVATSPDENIIKEIIVTAPEQQKPPQTLLISEMTPFFNDETVTLYAQDINQDGYRDIWFITDKGTANTYAVYWLYSQEQKKFVLLGKYPWLKLDVDNKTLKSYERHGRGGKIYTRSRYVVKDQVLNLLEQEKQVWDSTKKKYVKTVKKNQ